MAKGNPVADVATLQMALVGYEIEKQKIEARIQEIRSQLKGHRVAAPAASADGSAAGSRRQLSAAARRRIAAAQKRRWAKHRKEKAEQSKNS